MFLWLGALCSCQKDEVATDAMLSVSPARFNLLFYDTVLQITVAANVDYEVVPERRNFLSSGKVKTGYTVFG